MLIHHPACHFFFFFNDTATTEIYTLSLHDALPISTGLADGTGRSQFGGNLIPVDRLSPQAVAILKAFPQPQNGDRKSTRLNSSHGYISYAVFCLKKKKQTQSIT